MIKLTTDLRETVIAIAQDAAAAIMAVYATPFDVEIKSDHSPVTAADLGANQVIARAGAADAGPADPV
jgi:3'(2'), 5'-bisphosphate nucleotidase